MEAGEVNRQDKREVEQARDAYLATLTVVAKRTGFGRITDDVDKLLQFGENLGCEERVVDGNLLAEWRAA